jgi:Tfp pilus assembly protein FimT
MELTKASTGLWRERSDKGESGCRFLQNAGFSIAEVVIGVLLACTLTGFALIGMGGVMPGINANQAMNATVAQLRQGRDLAMTQRRSMQLRFLGNNQIQLVRNELPSGTRVVDTVTLGNQCQFMIFNDIPDTPDQFGNATPVDFGSVATLTFLSDGTLVDNSGNPRNGTVFIGLPAHPEAARAVTLLGATGRVRTYRWNGTDWIH